MGESFRSPSGGWWRVVLSFWQQLTIFLNVTQLLHLQEQTVLAEGSIELFSEQNKNENENIIFRDNWSKIWVYSQRKLYEGFTGGRITFFVYI